jgi:hypothetical protein
MAPVKNIIITMGVDKYSSYSNPILNVNNIRNLSQSINEK